MDPTENDAEEDMLVNMEEEGAAADDDDQAGPVASDEDEAGDDQAKSALSPSKAAVARAEKARLRDLKKRQEEELERVRAMQNEAVGNETAGKGKNMFKFLLAQTEIFAHFLSGGPGKGHTDTKKPRKRAGHAMSTEEEDEELKEEAAEGRQVRLTVQPSCIKGGTMREYQLAGLNWLIRLYDNGINGILADEMARPETASPTLPEPWHNQPGLGKTLQTISLLGYLHEYRGITGPHLIIVPKSTLGNWMNEIKRWCPVINAMRFHGNAEERNQQRLRVTPGAFDVIATTYEMVIKEKNLFKKFRWRFIIIDEAHRMKNENSVLAKTLRTFTCNNRLLITGTPLQNNLHELWALLNFLLPEVFHSSDKFDEWFGAGAGAGAGGAASGNQTEEQQQEAVSQLHKVLRPFLLRRLKADVEKGLPPKKEIILKVGMSELQRKYYKSLLQKDLDVIQAGNDRSRLLNVVMQLRKCCNHPYLFEGAEPGPPYFTGEHLVENAGKMVLLDKLLPRLKARDSRVLIFSQMTRMLDIMEDYMLYRRYEYCRIDGNTSGEDREGSIDAFNSPNSTKFCFLLSTRAGGLGINLATADIVIIYDSDWNPQMDLQAMDRAHRIGQKKEVQVFRFMTEDSVEAKVIEKAYKKLALDALIIQQGRLQDNKAALGKDDLLQMVKYGAEKIFSGAGATVTDEDIDAIIARGESETRQMTDKLQVFKEHAVKFSMEGDKSLYEFDDQLDEEEGGELDLKSLAARNWIDPPKRSKKNVVYNESLANQPPRQAKPPQQKIPGVYIPKFLDFQFHNTERLTEIHMKENRRIEWEWKQKNEGGRAEARTRRDKKGTAPDDPNADPNEPPALTQEEIEERERLNAEAFSNWSRKEFLALTKAMEKWGRDDLENVAKEVEGKTLEEVQKYSVAFWKNLDKIADGENIKKKIEKGEEKIKRTKDIKKAVKMKLERYKNPARELRIAYGQNKGKAYTEEEDRFLLCCIPKVGYGNWDDLKAEIRKHWLFRFDWFFKSRTAQELGRRVDVLVRLVEKEFEEEAEEDLKRQKDVTKGRGKRAADGAAVGTSAKKQRGDK